MLTFIDKPRKDSRRDIYERNNYRHIYVVNTRYTDPSSITLNHSTHREVSKISVTLTNKQEELK